METGDVSTPEELQEAQEHANSNLLIAMFVFAAVVFVVGLLIISFILFTR